VSFYPSTLTPDVDSVQLPSSSTRGFVADLVTLYYHVSLVAIDGYLHQSRDPADGAQYAASAREVLQLVAGRWAESLHLWPKFFMHTALIAALTLPADDPLVRRVYDLFANCARTLQTSGAKLLHKLAEHVQSAMGAERLAQLLPGVSPVGDRDLPMAMAYTASDSFWADLSGMLGLDGMPGQQEEWPRQLEWGRPQ